MNLLPRVLAWFRPDWPRILAALGLLVLATGAGLLKPWPLAWIIDRLDTTPGKGLVPILGALLGIHALHQILNACLHGLVIQTGLRGLSRIRRAAHEALLGLSLRQIREQRTGDLIHRATWDTYAFQTLFTQGVFSLAGAILSVAAMTAVMWGFNRSLTLLALAAIPPVLVVMRLFGGPLAVRASEARDADASLTARIQQVLSGLLTIQSFTGERRAQDRYHSEVDTAFRARWAQHRTEVTYLLAVGLVFAVATAGLVWMGSGEVRAGRLTTGQLLVFLAYLAQLHEPLSQLTHVGATVSSARAGAARVLDLLASRDPVPGGSRIPDSRAGAPPQLAFEDVSFEYLPGQPVLRNVRFRLHPGQTVALVGPSGAGKSTLLHLVARFLDPASGRVTWDGSDLREFRVDAIRSRVALLPQEPVLLPGSAAENIAFGRPDAPEAEIIRAARAVQADTFISRLPHGYRTQVGDGATLLSVGERQRLALARAFLKDAPVLLLDEPTSSLDSRNEEAVLQALAGLRRGRTTLMVTHRLATLRDVDRILVLVDGRIAEDGSLEELTGRGGWFSDWCRRENP